MDLFGNDELYWEMDLFGNDELYWEMDLFGNAGGKMQWTSLNLSDLSTTKMIHVEISSRTLLICITSQLTHKFRRQSKQRQERGREKTIFERRSLFAFLSAKKM